MTEQDYINLCKERAEEEARDVLKNYLRPFDEVIAHFVPNNQSVKEFIKWAKSVGATDEDLQKFKTKR